MALVRWQPINDFSSLQADVNRVFNAFFDQTPGNGGRSGRWAPPVDLVERDDQYVLTADLPGVSESDINIEVEDGTLVISGERKVEHESKGENFYRLERGTVSFSRAFTLPAETDPEQLHARFENGVLELTIPKPEERTPKRVRIEVGDKPQQIEGSEAGSQETNE